MQKAKRSRNTDKLVLVQRKIIRQGREVNQRQWVAGDNVRPDDVVLENEHNVRPYKYAQIPKEKPEHTMPAHSRQGIVRHRQVAALLAEVIQKHARSSHALI